MRDCLDQGLQSAYLCGLVVITVINTGRPAHCEWHPPWGGDPGVDTGGESELGSCMH